MINVRSAADDRGDLYVSHAFDSDFQMVLAQNVRRGARGDVARLASLRGIYMANVWDDSGPQPGGGGGGGDGEPAPQHIATGISFDNGGEWDFVKVPSELQSECNAADEWCALHFLGRSNGDVGQPPYSPANAVGIALATGNVGKYLDLDPEGLGTFLTRDGGACVFVLCCPCLPLPRFQV